MPAIGKLRSVPNRGNDGGRGLRTDAPDLRKAPAGLARPEDLFDLAVEPGDLLIKTEEAGVKLGQHRTEYLAEFAGVLFKQVPNLATGPCNRLGKCDAAIEE